MDKEHLYRISSEESFSESWPDWKAGHFHSKFIQFYILSLLWFNFKLESP